MQLQERDAQGTSLTSALIERLQCSLRGDVILRGDAEYEDACHLYNGMVTRRPAMIVRCTGVADVVETVRFARTHEIPVSVRGGGHNVAGNALVDDGLVIDLTRMKGIRVDPASRTARVEGGATWGDLDRETQIFGLATTGGLISSTGVAGLSLGGGLGWLMRKHGMAVDNLLAIDLVTADGAVLTASATQHPALFWAMRGAGHNFGVVTSMEFRLHPVGQILAGMVAYPIEQARDVLCHYRDVTMSAPDELIAFAGLMHTPDGAPICAVIMAYIGSVAEGERALRPLREFGTPALDGVEPVAYTELQTMLDGGFPFGLQNYWKSSFIRTLTDDAIDTVIEEFSRVTSPLNIALFEQFGGAVRRVPVEATAFSHREAAYNLVVISRWEEPDVAEAGRHIGWARGVWSAMQPFAVPEAYVNYLGADEDDRLGEAYGPGYHRLTALKQKYDPTNFFRVNQNIQPAG